MDVTIMAGISGSGKSTLAKQYRGVRICPDDIRVELAGDVNCQSENRAVFSVAYARLDACLRAGRDVVWDATTAQFSHLVELVEFVLAVRHDVSIRVVVVECPPDVAWGRIQRDIENGKVRAATPRAVVFRQHEGLLGVKRRLGELMAYGVTVEFVCPPPS